MKPYVLTDVPKEDRRLFRRVRQVVRKLPDVDLGRDRRGEPVLVSCHMVARALAANFPVACKDGYFGEGCATHSWLLTENDLVIDPYPWAMLGGPVLVHTGGMSPWRPLYREADLSEHFARIGEAFGRGVTRLTDEVRRLIEPRYDF